MRFQTWTIGLAGLVSFVAALRAGAEPGALPLVVDGKPKAVIVDSEETGPKGRSPNSAALLAACIERMSGARPAVIKEKDLNHARVEDGRIVAEGTAVGADTFVLVGEGPLARQLGVTCDGLSSGGLAMKTQGNALVLLGAATGPDTHGTRYAVVAFLEELGCRYLWPGDSGLVTPKMPTITVVQMDKRFTPPIGERNIRMQPRGPRFFDKGLARLGVTEADWRKHHAEAEETDVGISWSDWQGLNGYALGIEGGHNGCGLGAGGWEKYGTEHPEWFALQPDGTRDQSKAEGRYQLCLSNPDLIEFVSNRIIEEIKEAPNTISYSLSPNDGGESSFCMCENCKKLDPPDAPKVWITLFNKGGEGRREEIEYPALSDRFVHYWNAVAERVAKVYPNLLLVVDAYSVYSTPPVREKLHPNLVVRYVPSDPSAWEGWKQAGAKRIFWRPNNLHSGYREATINYSADARGIAGTMSLLANGGMIATDIQGIYDNWATQGLEYYVAARTMWNPKLTYDDILDDYCRSGFGPAAEAIKAYFSKAEALGRTYEKSTPEAMSGLKAELDAADHAAVGDEAILKRIAFLRAGLDYSTLTAQAARLRLAAQAGQPFDQAAATHLLEQRWQLMCDMYQKKLLAVNVVLVAGYEDTNWRDLGWKAPGEARVAAESTNGGEDADGEGKIRKGGKKKGAGGKGPAPSNDALQEDQTQMGVRNPK